MKRSVPFLAAAGLLLAAGCTAPGGPGSVSNPWFYPDAGVASDAPRPSAATGRCVPVRAEPLPARATVMSGVAAAPSTGRAIKMFSADLFGLFRSHCGACHSGAATLGSFNVNPSTFAVKIDGKVLDLIRSSDPAKVMPPPANGGKPFNERTAGDPVVELASLLERWIEQGKQEEFVIGSEEAGQAETTYLLSAEIGRRLTNLGDCVPERAVVGSSAADMDELDTRFAGLSALPDTLNETDMTSLDGEALARRGVVAFAPAYPLWADNAAKIRHIRVPRGQTVRFDKDMQQFSIPPNTRFYKTFLKKVIDREGNTSYKKIETRLIVSRPDTEKADGTAQVNALFGTYVWNEEETEARLLKDPLRNGQAFRDRVLTYATDEPKLEEVRATNPRNISFLLENKYPGLVRRYAIPSGQRCLDCHMGSDSASFILGFSPLQIARRPAGQGGILEAPAEDELNQLQRLIDYGVISGMTRPAEVLPLEKSQGERQPRNEHELTAQGYMLGACANCHNPRGFPSLKSPELKPILDMLPSATGGIFQFPLERFSPLRKRGPGQDVPMPYITPSLREYPVDGIANANWTPKWFDCDADGDRVLDKGVWRDCITRGGGRYRHIEAPWRSLLYRNVDTPYTYIDDFVMFPRMPMHGPGFDCRLRRIMGDWMVSIPAVRKNTEAGEDTVPGSEFPVDREPQPYREVTPGEPGYDAAKAGVETRLRAYHEGGRYIDDLCPDTTDIVDATIKGNPGDPLVPGAEPLWGGEDKQTMVLPSTRVPVRPHWVVTDLTEPGGDWNPRRANWADFLVKGMLPAREGDREAIRRQRAAVKDALATITITPELRTLTTTQQPFGLWESKPACADALTMIRTAGSIPEAERPRWMRQSKPPAEARLYMQSPGQAVYNNICFNCHGPAADSKGLMAEAIMLMSGGEARVANFRDGLFGPVTDPGANRKRVFGMATVPGATTEDLTARYMAWMALGGTEQSLPEAVLNIVATTRVMGKARASNKISPEGSPNMLELARELCAHTLPAVHGDPAELDLAMTSGSIIDWGKQTGLIDDNLDAEMWQRLCAQGNRQIVRVPFSTWSGEQTKVEINEKGSLYFAEGYPADAEVMDHRGQVHKGITRDNLVPLCIRKPSQGREAMVAEKWLEDNRVGGKGGPRIPYCPAKLFELGEPLPDDPPGTTREKWKLVHVEGVGTNPTVLIDVERWSLRGAVNAGIAVFLYLNDLAQGKVKPLPPYNKCEELARP